MGTLPDQRTADLCDLPPQRLTRQVDAKTGDRLEFVDGAAGVSQAATRHLREGETGRRQQRHQHDGGLIPYAAGAVLVDHRSIHAGPIERLAGADHLLGEGERLPFIQTIEPGRHEPGSDLIVGEAPLRHAAAEVPQLRLGVRPALLLSVDEGDHRRGLGGARVAHLV